MSDRRLRRLVVLAVCATVLACAASAFAQGGAPGAINAQGLPSSVLTTVQKTYPGATLTRVSQDLENGKTVFRVDCQVKGRRHAMVVDGNGSILQVADQVDEKDLPAPVTAAVHSHPRAIYVTGMKVTRGGDVRYELTLRGTRKTAMVVKPDGTVLSFK